MHLLSSIEIHERFLLSKVEFNFYISSAIKTVDPLFSSRLKVIKKAPIINRSRISKSIKRASIFSMKFES